MYNFTILAPSIAKKLKGRFTLYNFIYNKYKSLYLLYINNIIIKGNVGNIKFLL